MTCKSLFFAATVAFSSLALANDFSGTYGTCLNGTAVTTYGPINLNSTRSCFGKFTEASMDKIMIDMGYSKTGQGSFSAIYKSADSWVATFMSKDGSYVSEIILMLDRAI